MIFRHVALAGALPEAVGTLVKLGEHANGFAGEVRFSERGSQEIRKTREWRGTRAGMA
jgi:hypothetical protein